MRQLTVMRGAVVGGLLLTVALAACGDSVEVADDPSPEPVRTVQQSPTPADEPDEDQLALRYVEALASNDPRVLEEALALTADGSAAHAYLRFQIAQNEAFLDSGYSSIGEDRDVQRAGDGYELCDNGGRCTTLGGFAATDGLLINLEVDGVPPGPRLVMGSRQVVESNGVGVELLVAYQTIDPPDSLAVVLRLQTTSVSASPWLYQSTYRAPDGAQRTATDAFGPTDLGGDSYANALLLFDRVEPGGRVTLEGCVNDCADRFTVTVQVG